MTPTAKQAESNGPYGEGHKAKNHSRSGSPPIEPPTQASARQNSMRILPSPTDESDPRHRPLFPSEPMTAERGHARAPHRPVHVPPYPTYTSHTPFRPASKDTRAEHRSKKVRRSRPGIRAQGIPWLGPGRLFLRLPAPIGRPGGPNQRVTVAFASLIPPSFWVTLVTKPAIFPPRCTRRPSGIAPGAPGPTELFSFAT